jgi:hypothetical protein
LDARPLATDRQTGTDGQQSADELHRDQAKRRLWDFLVQHGLDVGNAASGGLRGESADEPGRDGCRCATSSDYEQQAG